MEDFLIQLRFFGLLSVCSASAVYTSLRRDLKYLLKVRYIILIYPNVAEFFIFNNVFCFRMETLSYMSQKLTAFVFGKT